ncbi:MAG TPA: hypothetical protein VFK78_10810 [Gemmatimonadales bacterium]|nr:hypothetical protein [Gemmatimonadales bacterium]
MLHRLFVRERATANLGIGAARGRKQEEECDAGDPENLGKMFHERLHGTGRYNAEQVECVRAVVRRQTQITGPQVN